MNKTSLSFLKHLLATPTPSGYEEAGQAIVADYMNQYADEVRRDPNGNVIGVLNPDAEVKIMLAGHCDEIGLMVQYIDDDGFVYISAIGGVNVRLLQGERIVIHGKKGAVYGVIGVKAFHMMTAKERSDGPPPIHDLWIDIGAKNRKDAEKVIRLGDAITIDTGWIELQNGIVACRAFDDRIGAFIIADVLRLLSKKKLNIGVYAVSTVQEEVGLRGAKMAAFGVDPQLGLAVDVGFATDSPGMNKKRLGEAKLGGGPIIRRGPTYNPWVFEQIEKTAKKLEMKVQHQPESRGVSTDAYALQMTRAGVPAGLISIPNRYMHSPVETIALKDAEDTVKLIAGFIESLTPAKIPFV